jgi:hypothetical protein
MLCFCINAGAGLLIDIAKECVQASCRVLAIPTNAAAAAAATAAATAGKGLWGHLPRFQTVTLAAPPASPLPQVALDQREPAAVVATAAAAEVAEAPYWLAECSAPVPHLSSRPVKKQKNGEGEEEEEGKGENDGDNESAAAVAASSAPVSVSVPEVVAVQRGQPFPLRKVFKDLGAVGGETVQIDALELVKDKKRSAINAGQEASSASGQTTNLTAASHLEGCFVNVHNGSTDLDEERLLEVAEAAPFLWPGVSPFLSPLMLRRFVLWPLKSIVEFTAEQVTHVAAELVTDVVISVGVKKKSLLLVCLWFWVAFFMPVVVAVAVLRVILNCEVFLFFSF